MYTWLVVQQITDGYLIFDGYLIPDGVHLTHRVTNSLVENLNLKIKDPKLVSSTLHIRNGIPNPEINNTVTMIHQNR